ncbi:MAG: tetratricopeptide repeat protein [Alphaproteobacteria bacterium]
MKKIIIITAFALMVASVQAYAAVQDEKADSLLGHRLSEQLRKTEAQTTLAAGKELFKTGEGLSKDNVDAVKLFRVAANLGSMEAQTILGAAYLSGDGVQKDIPEALKWIQKSAAQGDAKAQHLLGVLYHEGSDVKKDNVKSLKWIRKAAEQGLPSAQFSLGTMLSKGYGTHRDETSAMEWFHKSANQGYAKAQIMLGIAYHLGKDISKDDILADQWLILAGEKEARDDLEKSMTPEQIAEAINRAAEWKPKPPTKPDPESKP